MMDRKSLLSNRMDCLPKCLRLCKYFLKRNPWDGMWAANLEGTHPSQLVERPVKCPNAGGKKIRASMGGAVTANRGRARRSLFLLQMPVHLPPQDYPHDHAF